MPNYLDANLRSGDRAEYLAQYFLSAFGASVLVPRPEDIGIDYYCFLAKRNGRRLSFHSPFWVQAGTAPSEDSKGKTFQYGGVTKEGNWKHWEIDWLRDQRLPFFVATVGGDEEHRFRLYSGSAMWFVLYGADQIGQLELCPDEKHDPCRAARGADLETKQGVLPTFRVPLGPPVVDLRITDLGTELFARAASALEYALMIEYRNLQYRDIGVGHALRLLDHEPNTAGAALNYLFTFRPDKVNQQLDWLRPIAINLARTFGILQDGAKLEKLRPFFDLLPLSEEDRKLLAPVYPEFGT